MTLKEALEIADSIKQNSNQGMSVFLTKAHRDGYMSCLRDQAENIATICQKYNHNFDRDKFIKECGL